MDAVVYVHELSPADAGAMARVERQAYARSQRSGKQRMARELKEADNRGTNLSFGLFDAGKLVGFILAYVCTDRESTFENFEVSHTVAQQLTGGSVYVEDLVVLPSHARYVPKLLLKWLREIYRRAPTLPMDAFCTPALLERWRRHSRGFRRQGLELRTAHKVKDEASGEEWYWLNWERVGAPMTVKRTGLPGRALDAVALAPDVSARLIQDEAGWLSLAEDWNRLVRLMEDAWCFSTFEFLHTWWMHYGLANRLAVVALYRGSTLIGVAPLMVARKRILGPYRWRLEFIGDNALMERPALIVDPQEPDALENLARCVARVGEEHYALYLREQLQDLSSHPVIAAVDKAKFIVGQSEPVFAPHVAVEGLWDDYLGRLSKATRKSYRRKLRALQKQGTVRFSGFRDSPRNCAGLDLFLDVEAQSWKATKRFGITAEPERLAFYKDLIPQLEANGGETHFRFLYLNERPIAATFGFFFRGRYASIEICHDREYDRFSPGFVLTGLELKECHASEDYVDFDFLSGLHNNKDSWQTGQYESRHIYALPKTPTGYANRWLIFALKPAIKRLLARWRLDQLALDVLDKIQDRLP